MGQAEQGNTRRIWSTFWRAKYIILASIVVMVALAAAYTLSEAKVYQASAIVQVALPTSNPGTSDTTSANQALAQNYAAEMVSPGFLNTVRSAVAGGKESVSALQSKLSATALPQGALVELNANGPSPGAAQQLAQQVINGFIRNLQSGAAARTSQLQTQLENQVAALNQQISALSAQPRTTGITQQINGLRSSRDALIAQNATLVANGLAQGASATLSAAPVAASSPISPRKSLNILGGVLLGLVLGIALAWARESLRPAIHSADDVTEAVDLPLLASIPLKHRFRADDPTVTEAYGVLQANLTFSARAREVEVVTFTGFNPRVGKTSTVAGLAGMAARGERQVVLVDGDLRAAKLSERFGYSDRPGMVDVLQGRLSLSDALIQLDGGLWLLPSVPSRINARSLLSGERTRDLLAELRERFDLVLIDSPPLSGLADSLILASHSDAVVLVVRTGVTRPRDLSSVKDGMLAGVTPILGMVVFEDLPSEPYYYGATRQTGAERGSRVDRSARPEPVPAGVQSEPSGGARARAHKRRRGRKPELTDAPNGEAWSDDEPFADDGEQPGTGRDRPQPDRAPVGDH